MKKLLIIFLLALPLMACGQDHLQFMGQPITGSMKTFVQGLKKRGFETQAGKGWFKKIKCKYLTGDFWMFSGCDVVVRSPNRSNNVTSVYIHPHNNFLLLNQLIDVLDKKYGDHFENRSDADVNALTYVWDMPEGTIEIFGTIVYGQSFDILYRDYTEVNMLNHSIDIIDSDL